MPELVPKNLEEAVARLKPDRAAFAEVYDRQAPAGALDFKSVSAMRPVQPGEDDATAARRDFLAALQVAAEENWLDRFTPGNLAGLAETPEVVIALQAVTNPANDFDHVGDLHDGLLKAMKCCCRVICGDDGDGGGARGSGFLIGPQLVLTNWHVVQSQIAADAKARADAGPDAVNFTPPPPKIRVEFDAMRRRDKTVTKPTVEAVADDWLVAYCEADGKDRAPTQVGVERELPLDLAILEANIDFAVIALAEPVGYARDWYDLPTNRPPPKSQALGQLVQFPGAFAMRVSAGPYLEEPAYPGRFTHSMNTIGGSSGGLCTTSSYEPLALHQGALKLKKGMDPVEQTEVVMGVSNIAIPLVLIAEHAGSVIADRAKAAPGLLYQTIDGAPIIGRKVLQRAIHDTIYGANRLIVVRNSFDTQTGQLRSGVGKSFTIQVLEAMVRPGEHTIRRIDAASLTADPFVAALAIAQPFRDPTADDTVLAAFGALDALNTARPAGDSTQDADVRALADALLEALRLAATDRTLWLVIDELDRHPVDSASLTSNLLNLLYAKIAIEPRLRVVLLGPTAILPSLEALGVRTEGPLQDLDDGEIEEWITKARGRNRPMSTEQVENHRKIVVSTEPHWRPEQIKSRTARIADYLRCVLAPVLR